MAPIGYRDVCILAGIPFVWNRIAFKMRYDEIRLGVGKKPVAKTGGQTDYVDLSQLGINLAHHILFEGSNYKPERRSVMTQTLSPLTAFVTCYRSQEPYKSK